MGAALHRHWQSGSAGAAAGHPVERAFVGDRAFDKRKLAVRELGDGSQRAPRGTLVGKVAASRRPSSTSSVPARRPSEHEATEWCISP